MAGGVMAQAPKPRRRQPVMELKDPQDKPKPAATKKLSDLDDWLRDALELVDEAHEKEKDNVAAAYEDLEFRAGEHWPEADRAKREKQKRPIITVNDVPQFVRQITGDIRLMKPSIKAIPIDARATEPVAKLLSGMIRYIENRSHARVAYSTAADSQVACGVGHWRVTTEYAEETTFNQECRIVHVEDGVGVLWDPDAILPTREDAMWCLVPVDISRSKFKKKYPDVPETDFANYDTQYTSYWSGAETLRVGEFWEKRPAKRRLALYPDGSIHDLTNAPDGAEKKCIAEGAEIKEKDGYKVFRALITLGHILEKPEEWPGRYIPVIRVAGEEVRIGRRIVRHGVVRFIKDPTRLYNYARSQQAELYGLAPKAPWIGTEKNFEDSLAEWETANEENWPFLTYKPDTANGNAPPQRVSPPTTSPGLSEAVALSLRDKQGVTGIYNVSLGQKSNETSGVAIKARESQSDVGNVVYIENFSLAVAHTGTVLLDLTPHVYDTERMVQIQDEDGTVRTVTINKALVSDQTGEPQEPVEIEGSYEELDGEASDVDAVDLDPQGTKQENTSPNVDSGDAYENDVTIGAYAIAFEPGPAYSTKREEAKDGMAELVKAAPDIVPLILDLYVKAQDWPMAAEIAERLQAMLPPPIKAQIAMEKAKAEGAPPEMLAQMEQGANAPPEPPPPNPADVAAQQAEVVKAQAGAETAKINVDIKAIERDIKALELKVETAKAMQIAGASEQITQGLVEEIASLHGMVSEIVAMMPRPEMPMDGPMPPMPPADMGAPVPVEAGLPAGA